MASTTKLGALQRITSGITDAIAWLRKQWGQQYEEPATSFTQHSNTMERWWEYYCNCQYLDKTTWQGYLYEAGLYRHTRPIFNPVFKLASFYEGIYPGLLTPDANQPIDGTPLAIPLASNTPQPLREAIGQIWEWSNWQDRNLLWLRIAAVTGTGPVKIVDDPSSGKVILKPLWPGHFYDLAQDDAGNITMYHLRYDIKDPRRSADDISTVTYEEIVTKESIRTLIDGRHYGFNGNPGSYPNPYGFVPLVWWRFVDMNKPFGAPAFAASLPQVDEICSLGSMTADQVMKHTRAPILLSGVEGIDDKNATLRDTPTTDFSGAQAKANRESYNVLEAPEGARIETIPLDVRANLDMIEWLEKQVESNHSELTIWSTLRQMTQTTGPAVEALLGDVVIKFTTRAASADVQTRKMLQMATAIAGYRANNGDWNHLAASNSRASLDAKRSLFLDYDLDSYLAGDLDMHIRMRRVTPRGEEGEYAIQQARGTAWKSLTDAGIPLEYVLRQNGYSDEEIARIVEFVNGSIAKVNDERKRQEMMDQAKATFASRPPAQAPAGA